jgi:hypothetical protein
MYRLRLATSSGVYPNAKSYLGFDPSHIDLLAELDSVSR